MLEENQYTSRPIYKQNEKVQPQKSMHTLQQILAQNLEPPQQQQPESEQMQPIEIENLLVYHFAVVNLHAGQLSTIDLKAGIGYVSKVQMPIYAAYNQMAANLLKSLEDYVDAVR